MNYKEEILVALKEEFGDNYEMVVTDVKKTNGVEKTGVSFIEKDDGSVENNITAVFYLDPMIERLEEGMEPWEVAKEVYDTYMEKKASIPVPDIMAWSKEDVLPLVFTQVVNAKSNSEMLKDIPHEQFLDLAVVYRCSIPGINGSFIINSAYAKRIDVTQEEMKAAAKLNAENDGYVVKSMMDMMAELMGVHPDNSDCDEDKIPGMYVMTNQSKLYGSSAILKTDLFRSLSEQLDNDILILPSSIHELILIPDQDSDISGLRDMVMTVNRTQVEPNEILSDQVYRYSRETGTINIA